MNFTLTFVINPTFIIEPFFVIERLMKNLQNKIVYGSIIPLHTSNCVYKFPNGGIL